MWREFGLEDWPHVNMGMGGGMGILGGGGEVGEDGARAHTLQGLIRRVSRLYPVSVWCILLGGTSPPCGFDAGVSYVSSASVYRNND